MLPNPLPADPLPLFEHWFDDAHKRKVTDNPNAMVLATVDVTRKPPQPSARVVLCKAIDAAAGHLTFFTNYTSRKGRELAAAGRCSAVFHWDGDERQVRIEGIAVPAPGDISDAYFNSRHAGSRVGAWASEQSQPLASRDHLLTRVQSEAARFGVPLKNGLEAESVEVDIPRPEHWGGYHLWIEAIELWHGGSHRVHDRARFERSLELVDGGMRAGDRWSGTRLNP
ncbi:MAG: pyridoxamine 5'-phosphate oxidase [Gammaproteobacteria bacterium]